MKDELKEVLKDRARDVGFDLVGIADVRPSDHADFYREWLDEGHHGEMGYLARPDAVERRADVEKTLAGVRSAVVVAQSYFVEDPEGVPDDAGRAVVARYARGRDYHAVVEEGLESLLAWLRKRTDGDVRGRAYVDTGPILERELARRAGLGWFGRNTMLLNPRAGSYLFLGVLLLDLELEPEEPFTEDHCGTCSRCVEACPTDALLGRDEDGAPVMNARRCISYLTIENRGPIPRELRPLLGNRVYGCDICQEVCPWNVQFAEPTDEPAYAPKPEFDGPTLVELAERLLPMSENGFLREYADSAVSRARRKGLLRNVCVGLGNWLGGGEVSGAVLAEAVDVLVRALYDDRPLVRGHAAWALGEGARGARRRSDGEESTGTGRDHPPTGRDVPSEASRALSSRLEIEEDDWVREEIREALGRVRPLPGA